MIVAVENSDTIQNVVVCTLCSCYPRALLGLPPDWYKSFSYRSRMVAEPRVVLKEFGLELGPEVEVRVYDGGTVLWRKRLPYAEILEKKLPRLEQDESLRVLMEKTLHTVQAAIAKGKLT